MIFPVAFVKMIFLRSENVMQSIPHHIHAMKSIKSTLELRNDVDEKTNCINQI